MQSLPPDMLEALHGPIAAALRWSGAIARQLRHFNIAIDGKTSGNPTTDALTLADLAVQELLVAALRDCGEVFRQCRIDAEESSAENGNSTVVGEIDEVHHVRVGPVIGAQWRQRKRTGDR